jgi:hypothetical protein
MSSTGTYQYIIEEVLFAFIGDGLMNRNRSSNIRHENIDITSTNIVIYGCHSHKLIPETIVVAQLVSTFT